MAVPKYDHLVEYDEAANKIVITRVFKSGNAHLYTELPIDDVDPAGRTFAGIGRMLGETLILDMRKLCDEVLPQAAPPALSPSSVASTDTSSNAIARRTFTIGPEGRRQLEVLVYAPVDDGDDYRCDYEIVEDGKVAKTGYAIGVDSLQALILALQILSVSAVYSDVAVKRDLYWLGDNDDLGLLPMPGCK